MEENRDLGHWQMSSANIVMEPSGPAMCSCILSPCHGVPHISRVAEESSGVLTKANQ